MLVISDGRFSVPLLRSPKSRYSEFYGRGNSWPTIFFILGDEIYSKENRRPSIVSWATILEVRRPRLSWPTILKKQGDDFCKIVAQERDYKMQRFGTLTILSLSLCFSVSEGVSLSIDRFRFRFPDPTSICKSATQSISQIHSAFWNSCTRVCFYFM